MEHQAIAKLLAESPRLVPVLLHRALGLDVPLHADVVPAPETIRDVRRPDYAVDGTVVVCHDDPARREAFAIEIQREPDADKAMSWPLHVAGLRCRLNCPVTLVVVTCSERTARWARRPIDLGRGSMVLCPVVIGPRQIPRVTDPHDAHEHPELAVLGVIAHGRKSGSKRLGQVALEAILGLARRGHPRATLLFDIVMAFLDRNVARRLVKDMDLGTNIRFSDFAKHHFALGLEEGEAVGRARALLLVLEARGIAVGPEQRQRILECTDPAILDRWIARSVGTASTEELLGA